MWGIQEPLVHGVAVDGRDQSVLDTECIVEDFGDGCEAVRGARRIRDDLVLATQQLVVHTDTDSCIRLTRRC